MIRLAQFEPPDRLLFYFLINMLMRDQKISLIAPFWSINLRLLVIRSRHSWRNGSQPFVFLFKETLINFSVVIPAKAGIQKFKDMDSGMRRNDELFRASLNTISATEPRNADPGEQKNGDQQAAV